MPPVEPRGRAGAPVAAVIPCQHVPSKCLDHARILHGAGEPHRLQYRTSPSQLWRACYVLQFAAARAVSLLSPAPSAACFDKKTTPANSCSEHMPHRKLQADVWQGTRGLHLVFKSRLLLLHRMLDLLCIRLVPVAHLMPARLEPVLLNNMGLHDISGAVRSGRSTETAATVLHIPLERRGRCL